MNYLIVALAGFTALAAAKLSERAFRVVTTKELAILLGWVCVLVGAFNATNQWLQNNHQDILLCITLAAVLGVVELLIRWIKSELEPYRKPNASSTDACDDDEEDVEPPSVTRAIEACEKIGWSEGVDAAKRLGEDLRKCDDSLNRIEESIEDVRGRMGELSKSKKDMPKREALKATRDKLRGLRTRLNEAVATNESALDDLCALAIEREHGDLDASNRDAAKLLERLNADNRLLADSKREVETLSRL